MCVKNIVETDVCVLGAGVAGLSAALKIPKGNKVTVISHLRMGMCASAMAQCGIAAAVAPGDSAAAHVADVLGAGATLAKEDIVNSFATGAVAELEWLEKQGVNFHKKADGSFILNQESGHDNARLANADDETGKAIMTVLQKNINASTNINTLCECKAIDFVTRGEEIIAVKLLNISTNEFVIVKAKCFVLATGGASGLFARYTNPSRVIGGGVAMAWRAGCSVANMEFQHFHPICFDHAKMPGLFIAETLLENGVNLSCEDGSKFMPAYTSSGKFLPRDVAARIFGKHQRATGGKVYLDVTDRSKKWVKNCCPAFYRACASYGVDITKTKIPVYPSSHYTCGGIVVDENGLTNFKNLYAIGEVAYTGLHGADRLCASAVMEGVVFATKAAEHIGENISNFKIEDLGSEIADTKGADFVFHEYNNYCHNIQSLMWENVGVIRSNSSLLYAMRELTKIKTQVDEVYLVSPACHKVIEIRNMVLTALIMTQSAILRKESRGVHYNEDYPYVSNDYDGLVTELGARFVSFGRAMSACDLLV